MNIFLAGATGQVGYALTHALSKTDHQTSILVRNPRRLQFPSNIRVSVAPEFAEAIFAEQLKGIDCAIYGIGLPEQYAADTAIFTRVNYGLLRTFLNALEKSSVRRLVYVSTYEVFETRQGLIRESHPLAKLQGLSPYFKAMTQAFAEVTQFAERTQTKLTTIHPAALYGGLNTSEGFTNVIENLLNWRLWKLPVTLPGRFPLVHADSLAQGILKSLDHPGAFILSDGMSSLKELAQALRQQTRSYLPPQIPAGLAYASVLPLESAARFLGLRPMLCKVQLDFITSGAEPVADQARKVLGFQPLALSQGLQLYLKSRDGLLALHD